MISVTSVTDRYALQPGVMIKHKKALEWLSSTVLWKREFNFFQKLLDQYGTRFSSADDKKKIGHFQSIITYYGGELIDSYAAKLREHESRLAQALENHDETRIEYFKEHDALMGELESLQSQIVQYKEDFFHFIEKVV
jgi:hypothetical protein